MNKEAAVIFLLMLPIAAAQTFSEVQIMVPAVAQDPDTGVMYGVPVRLDIKMMTPGTGEIFVNTRALTQMDMQGSARLAAIVAGDITDTEVDNHNFLITLYSNTTIIGGPSAGAAMTVAMAALMVDLELRDDTMMTGMITLDGAIGVVGGIPEKAHAAHLSGAEYFLIPEGQQINFNSTTYEDVNVTEMALEKWNVTVVEISDVREAVSWFTGLPFPPRKMPSTPLALEAYQEMMRRQSDGELLSANISLETSREVLNSVAPNLSSNLLDLLEADLNFSEERLSAAWEAYNGSLYYVASSKAFQSRIASRRVRNLARFHSVATDQQDEVMDEIWAEAEESIRRAEEALEGVQALGITGIECYAATQSRLVEARQVIEDSEEWYALQDYDLAVGDASYAAERALTAELWANITRFFSEGPPMGEEDLRELAEGLFADASIIATYADLLYEEVFGLPISWVVAFIPEYSFIDPYPSLDTASIAVEEGLWPMAVFESLESEVRAGIAIEFINVLVLAEDIDQAVEMLASMANKSAQKSRVAIEDSRDVGVEPVLAVSRHEFSDDLSDSDEISYVGEAVAGYRYATSIARLSPTLLELYVPSLELAPITAKYLSGRWNLTGVAVDPNGDTMTMTIELGEISIQRETPSGSFVVPVDTTQVPDGRHELFVEVSDGILADSDSFNVTIDNNPPEIHVTDLRNGTILTSVFTPVFEVSDAVDPDPMVSADLDGSPFAANVSVGEGDHFLRIVATDDAGWSRTLILNFSVDIGGPVIELPSVQNGSWFITPASLIWGVHDEVTQVYGEWRLDEDDWRVAAEINSTFHHPGWATWFNTPLDGPDGKHNLSLRTTDSAGHTMVVELRLFFDGSSPEIRIDGVEDGWWYDRPVRALIFATDEVDPEPGIWVKLDAEAYVNGTEIGPGRHLLEASARDVAGNEAGVRKQFVVDLEAPVLAVSFTEPTTYPEGEALTEGDAFPWPIWVDCMVSDDLDISPVTDVSLDGLPYKGEQIGSGTHDLEIRASDKAGNERTEQIRFYVDLAPPRISLSLENGAWYTEPVKPNLTVSDDIDPALSVSALLNDVQIDLGEDLLDDLEQGSYRLRIEAHDHALNSATLEIVFYLDFTPPEIDLGGLADGGQYRKRIVPDLVIRDNVDGSPEIEVRLNGEPYELGTELGDGHHLLVAVGHDRAGNRHEVEVSFTIDSTKPSLTVDLEDGGEYDRKVVPKVEAHDELGEVEVRANLDGSAYEIGSQIGPGSHTLVVEAVDEVGNVARLKVAFTVRGASWGWLVLPVASILVVLTVLGLSRGRRDTRRQVYRF